LDAFRLSLEKYKEFYDYNPKNPPLFEQFEKEV